MEMETLVLKLLNMSIAAGWLILPGGACWRNELNTSMKKMRAS